MKIEVENAQPMLVACLCAAWCGSCRDYRATFDAVAARWPEVQFRWVDIEDESELVDPIDVENFPTLLIAQAEQAVFLGPVTPQAETLTRLVKAHSGIAHGQALQHPDVHAVVKRIRAMRP